MKSFIQFFVNRHIVAYLLTLSIILLGASTIPNIHRDTFPSADLDETLVVTAYPSASPKDIELKITNKIEKKLKSIDGIREFTSISAESSSIVRIILEEDIENHDEVRQNIDDEIDKIDDFPSDLDIDPSIIHLNPTLFPILEIGLSSEKLNYLELRKIAKQFKNELESTKGVSSLIEHGYKKRQLNIFPDINLLNVFQISLQDILSFINSRNLRSSMGNFEKNNTLSTIINDSRLFNENDIKNAIIRSNFNGQAVRLSDIATIIDEYEEPAIQSRVNSKQGISFVIIKNKSADIISLTERVSNIITRYKTIYPSINFNIANNVSKYLKNRLSVMISNGIIGLIFVVIVLTIFLDFKMAFWVSLGIPVALMGVFIFMPMFGITINVVSLTAMIITLGIIVDDGIIIAENIQRHRENGESLVDASVKGTLDVFKPVLTTILTTIIAFSPMLFMKGVLGKFIYEIPLIITIALLISLVEVILALPSHIAATKFKKNQTTWRKKILNKAKNIYKKFLRKCLNKKTILILTFIVIFIGTFTFAVKKMNFVLFPESASNLIIINIETPAGTSLEKTSERMISIEKEISKLSTTDLDSFTTRIGQGGDQFFLSEQKNLGVIFVELDSFSGRKKTAREIMTDLKHKTENLPGFKSISYRIDSGGPPVGEAIRLRVVSNDNKRRKIVTDELFNFVNQINGVVSLERNDKKQKRQLVIQLNYEKIAQLGINIATIQQTIRTAFVGINASSTRIKDEDIDIRIELKKSDKGSMAILKKLLIPNNRNNLITLDDIATFKFTDGSPNFYHFNGARSITITGDINKDIVTSTKITNLVQEKFNKKNYSDIIFDFGGESEETDNAVNDLFKSFGLAIIGIFFLLLLLFNSFLQPLIVIMTIPFGLIGVIIIFALHGEDLSFISMVGTVGLTGVIVNDSLVLVNHLNKKLKQDPTRNIINIVVEGSADRFRPILITSLTTVAGLLPLAYGIGGSDPFIAPMALAIGYGLIFSTPLILILLPVLYLTLHQIRNVKK